MTFEFLITALIIIATPGTGAIFTISCGLAGGLRGCILAAIGCTTGIIPHVFAANSGLAAVLSTSAYAFQILIYLGVAYLLYMAWATYRSSGLPVLDANHSSKKGWQVIASAVLINFLNPKLSLFFLAFIPQFIGHGEVSPVTEMVKLSLAFMALTCLVFIAYGVFAAAFRRHVLSSVSVQSWMKRGFAAAFLGLAIQLAVRHR